jgi:hypothetical protein
MRAQKTVQRAKQTGLLKGCFLAISMSDPQGPGPGRRAPGPSLGLSQPAGWPGGGHGDPGDFKMRRDPAQWPGGEPPGPGESDSGVGGARQAHWPDMPGTGMPRSKLHGAATGTRRTVPRGQHSGPQGARAAAPVARPSLASENPSPPQAWPAGGRSSTSTSSPLGGGRWHSSHGRAPCSQRTHAAPLACHKVPPGTAQSCGVTYSLVASFSPGVVCPQAQQALLHSLVKAPVKLRPATVGATCTTPAQPGALHTHPHPHTHTHARARARTCRHATTQTHT